MEGARVLILSGRFKGNEGVCLGEESSGQYAVSADESDQILSLRIGTDFALLVDLSADPSRN